MVVYLLDVVEMPYNYEDIILINNEWQYEFFRLRSAGCRDDARELLYSIPPSNEADCYFVGQHFFEFEEYYPAIEMLTYCIDFGYRITPLGIGVWLIFYALIRLQKSVNIAKPKKIFLI